MKNILLKILCMSVVFITSNALAATTFPAFGSIYLYATGLNANKEFDPKYSPIYLTLENKNSIFQQASITSYGSGFNADGILDSAATFTSFGSISANEGNLGVGVTGYGQGGWAFSPSGGGEVSVSWTDEISLVYNGTGQSTIFPGSSILLNYTLEGVLATSINGEKFPGNGVHSAASINFSSLSKSISFASHRDRSDLEGQDAKISTQLSVAATIDPIWKVGFSTSLSAKANSSWGSGSASFLNTLSFDSVTFLDGTTPESRGFDVIFASGIQSPNLTNVPLPSAFWLFGIGFITLIRYKERNSHE